MTTYVEVAQALVTAGYVSDADLQAAADVLADALIIEAAEEAQDDASEDYATQEDIVAEAEVWEREDSVVGDYDSVDDDEAVIEDALEQGEIDKEVVLEAEALIDAACTDAGAALLAAKLIDEANLELVVAIIHEYNCE